MIVLPIHERQAAEIKRLIAALGKAEGALQYAVQLKDGGCLLDVLTAVQDAIEQSTAKDRETPTQHLPSIPGTAGG